MTHFSYVSTAQEVIFGPGTLAQLGEAVAHFGWDRILLCTIERFQAAGLVAQIERVLGQRLVAIYAQVQPHVPQNQVEAALALAIKHDVKAVIGLGGGSPIGMAKAVGLALEEQRTGQPARAAFPTDQPLVPVIAIPTTYAGSEMTPIYGVTQQDGETIRKITVTDHKVTPQLTIYDPELTVALPPEMTASSGINALAHCIETLYSITRNPLSTAAALEGIRHITRALPQAVANGSDLQARSEMFIGSHLAAAALAKIKIGLHHGLCHVLGGTVGVPHGVANSVMLPHVMRFNSDATAAELAAAAGVMGVTGASDIESAEKVTGAITELISQIGLPQRLRDVGVAEAELPHLAQIALKSRAVQNNPKPITDAAQTESVLRAAW